MAEIISFIFLPFFIMADIVSLVKNEAVPLLKADGSALSHVRVGLSWDTAKFGSAVDLDLFVVRKADKKITYFGNKTALTWVELSEDNLTGAWDGDDEFAKFDASKTEDGEYYICVDIYRGQEKNQFFQLVSNAKATIYNQDTNEKIAEYNITADGGKNTGIIVGVLKDIGNMYMFEAKWTYVNGDINVIAQSI